MTVVRHSKFCDIVVQLVIYAGMNVYPSGRILTLYWGNPTQIEINLVHLCSLSLGIINIKQDSTA